MTDVPKERESFEAWWRSTSPGGSSHGALAAWLACAAEKDRRIADLEAERDRLLTTLNACQWYWPEDDTESENCVSCPLEVVECAYGWNVATGDVVAVARGGIVEVTYCAALPPAADAESDDEFWVAEKSRAAARAKIEAELARRAALSSTGGE